VQVVMVGQEKSAVKNEKYERVLR